MFNTIKNWIKEVINKMFNKNTIESKTKVDIAVSNEMSNHIELCKQIHENKAPWIDNKTVFSSNTGVGIAAEFARLVTIEFKSEISNNPFLNKEYQVVVDNIRNYTQFAAAEGGIVFKPYVSNNHIEVDMTRANMFFPTSFNSRGDILGAVFVETKTEGEDTYTRLEYHNLITQNIEGKETSCYQIKNSAFRKKNYNSINAMDQSLGDEISLTEVEEWANLQPEVTIKNVDRPLFAYFKMPLANTIDSASPLGVSVYSNIAEPNGLLEQVDRQYSKILWEYSATEVSIDANMDYFKKDSLGNPILPVGKERLYRALDIGIEEGGKGWNIFSPQIRDVSLFNGLNELLRKVEFQCGLAVGTLSELQDVSKTATEIKSSKQRSFQTVKDIQKSLQNALEALAYAMSVLGQLYKLPVKPVNLETEISYSFDDSIMVDKETEMNKLFTYVSSGILKAEYLLKKDLGMSDEEIKMYMPEQTIIQPSPFDVKE